jgi:hypothetical protein
MSKGNTTEDQIIQLAFRQADPSWRTNANFFVALHTADPGEAGDQTNSECAYTGYARAAVSRDVAGWDTVAGGQADNAAIIVFGACTAGAETITHASIGLVSSGASQIIYKGALTAPINVSAGITPSIAPGALVVTED